MQEHPNAFLRLPSDLTLPELSLAYVMGYDNVSHNHQTGVSSVISHESPRCYR